MKTEVFESHLQQLPPIVQQKVLRYRKWQDKQRCVIGHILLMRGLLLFGNAPYSLDNLQYTEYQRPYISSTIDFNISHAHDFTICALSETNRVGIDVEKIQSIDIHQFDSQFSVTELNQLSQAADNRYAFYKLWTQKEAFIKAVGTGLNIPLNKITIENERITQYGQDWFLKEIQLHEEYLCHLCTSTLAPPILIREIHF